MRTRGFALLFVAACAQQETAQAPTAPTASATATASASATPMPTPSATAATAPATPDAKVASMHAGIASIFADLDEQELRSRRCTLDAKTATTLSEERAHTRASADAYLRQLDVLGQEARTQASLPADDPTKAVRTRDLEQRLDELADQIRRVQTRASLLGETVRTCS